MISATNKTVAIKYIVVLYKLEVGSTVPLGAISINLFIVTVFAPTNCSSWSTPAPNLVLNVAGSIFTIKSFIDIRMFRKFYLLLISEPFVGLQEMKFIKHWAGFLK